MFYQITLRDVRGFAHPCTNELIEAKGPEAAEKQFYESLDQPDRDAINLFLDQGYKLHIELREFDQYGVMRVTP